MVALNMAWPSNIEETYLHKLCLIFLITITNGYLCIYYFIVVTLEESMPLLDLTFINGHNCEVSMKLAQKT